MPGGKKLVQTVLQEYGIEPAYSGPSATIPSRLHAFTIQAISNQLYEIEKNRFTVFNEFNGLRGVFPIDAGIYDRGELLSFIEIDGEMHYKQINQQLRRKDKLKEFLYKFYYPEVPLFRIRSDQVDSLGIIKASKGMAAWIYALANNKERKSNDPAPLKEKKTTESNADSDSSRGSNASVTGEPKIAKKVRKTKASSSTVGKTESSTEESQLQVKPISRPRKKKSVDE